MLNFEIFLEPAAWVSLLTLTFLEIVLGIDNIIFISILSNKVPKAQQRITRNMGLGLAMIFRVLLLLMLNFIMGLTQPIVTIPEWHIFDFAIESFHISGHTIILFLGGLFLIAKSTTEIHEKMTEEALSQAEKEAKKPKKGKQVKRAITFILLQIILIDLVFSLDSILTAIGLSNQLLIMALAIIVAILIMMMYAGPVSRFIDKHPTLQILALSFLILIGFLLILESLEFEVPKGYIYFAVFFSLIVEVLNIRLRGKHDKSNK